MKNLSKIQVVELHTNESVEKVIQDSLQIKTTGDPDAGAASVTDLVLHGAANTLQSMYTGSKLSPPTYTAGQVTTQKNKVITLYNKNALYVKSVAIDVANTAADVNAGITVVTRTGFNVAKKTGGKRPDFGVTASGPNWVQIHVKKSKKGAEGHKWRFALVTEKGTPPAKTTLIDESSMECDIVIQDLPTGSILAIQHAPIIPVAKKRKTRLSLPLTGKKAKPTAGSKANHPVISFTSPDAYAWSDFIYIGIQ